MLRRVALVTLAGAAMIGACSVYSAESPFVADDGGTSDALASTDANANVSDGSSTDDAGDAADTGDAADPRRFCEKQDGGTTTFCRDFDDGAPLFFGFSSQFIEDGGAIALDTTILKTPPASLSFSLPAGLLPFSGGSYTSNASVLRSFPAPAEAHFAYDLYVENAHVSLGARNGAFCTNGGDRYCSWLGVSAGKTTLVEQEFPEAGTVTRVHDLVTSVTMAQWTHVELVWKLASPRGVTVKLDGFEVKASSEATPPAVSGTATFEIGVVYFGGPGDVLPPGTTVRYDNFTIDLK
jgi:hypothetical protein